MTTENNSGLSALSVLVIDDHEMMRSIFRLILNGLGIEKIETASNARTALKMVQKSCPDIIFVDLVMDGMSGIEFVRRVRNDETSPDQFVPIVMASGHADYERVVEARDAGVTEFLAKPISALAVAQRLETLIHHPRPFVRASGYFGPDRRRQRKEYKGDDRRVPQTGLLSQNEIDALIKS